LKSLNYEFVLFFNNIFTIFGPDFLSISSSNILMDVCISIVSMGGYYAVSESPATKLANNSGNPTLPIYGR